MERPLSPVVVDGEEEFEVEAILRHRALVPGVSIRCCGKVIPSPRLVGSLSRISAMLLRSWRNICATSQLRRQYAGDSGIDAAGGILDVVPEDLPGCCRSSGWKQLVMGHYA